MSALIFRHSHRVTYAECTVGNHVYYARYLDLLEEARGEFFRAFGVTFLNLQQQDTFFPVVECRLRYKAPARYDDVLAIEIWPALAEGIRLNFTYRILNQTNTLILEAETQHVCAGSNDKLKRLTDDLAAKLRPYMRFPKEISDPRI
jgi:acyl-CoA thioester hydrolase